MFNEELKLAIPLRWGMVGGGRGSQIGYSHRISAMRSGNFELIAGVFDIDPEKSKSFAHNIGIVSDRVYDDYLTMFQNEKQRSDGIQVVSIVTPNSTHYQIAKAALEFGIHVICEKPITFTIQEAEILEEIATKNHCFIAVMYGYSGYSMIHQARSMVTRGEIGKVRVINMQFAHGFHNIAHELNNPSLKWRVDPKVAGPTYVLGDLATHTFYLAELITGLTPKRLKCFRQSFIPSRAPLEDNAHVFLEYSEGAVGTMWASAINAGSTHQQKIRIVGELASLEWWDEFPNQLRYEIQGKPVQILDRGMSYLNLDDDGVDDNFIGSGHPEGYFESWTNLYRRFSLAITNFSSEHDNEQNIWYPGIQSGINGVKFCQRCVESSELDSGWVNFD